MPETTQMPDYRVSIASAIAQYHLYLSITEQDIYVFLLNLSCILLSWRDLHLTAWEISPAETGLARLHRHPADVQPSTPTPAPA